MRKFEWKQNLCEQDELFNWAARYVHKKNLDKSKKKNHKEGQNWFMKTILQSKSLEKTEIYQILML